MEIVIVGIGEKYSDKASARSQCLCGCLDVIDSAHGRDGAKTRVFKNPIERFLEGIASQKISNNILFTPLAFQRLGVANGRRG